MNVAPEAGALVDPGTVRVFCRMIHEAAARALHGAIDPGAVQLDMLHPNGGNMHSTRFPIGASDAMADVAINAAMSGLNVYVEGRTIDIRASAGRGKANSTRGVFAFVDDSDSDKGKAGTFALAPSLRVETSPGNEHRWLLLDRALTPEQAEPLGRALRAWAGSDSASGKVTQPYRVAGTPNYPDAKKRARGRVAVPTRLLDMAGPVWSAVDLGEIVPPAPERLAAHVPGGRSGTTSGTVEDLAAETGPDRSERFYRTVAMALRSGMLPGDLEDVFRRFPSGCGSKYLEPTDRLAEEIARAWGKVQARAEEEAAAAATGVEPTYPNHSVHVAEARAAVREAIGAHLAAGTGYRAVRVGTGVGKTRIAAELIAQDVRRRRAADDERPMLYAVPRHKLGDEVARLFEAEGVSARVFRGRTADDPDVPDTGIKMCLDIEAVTLALQLGAPVGSSCCRGKHPTTGEVVSCPSFGACSYQAQLFDRPAVWIVPHQLLFQAQSALGEVAGVVIDESFWQAGYKAPGKGLTLDEVGFAPPLKGPFLDSIADVAAYRGKLAAALRRQDGTGGVARAHLAAEGIDAELCTKAIAAEWRLKTSVEIWPGMGQQARRAAAKAAAGTRHVRSYVAVWNGARDLLQQQDEAAVSGRLLLADTETEEGTARVVRTTGIRPIASAWADAPTLALDATLPDLAILRQFYPEMELVADIEAQAPHAKVRQVTGAPTSANKLMRSEAERNLGEVRRALLHRFIEFGRAPTLVVAQMKVAEWLRDSVLPAGIEVAHFNAIAGLDGFKGVRLLVVVGRTLPNVVEVEAMAGAVTGVEVVRTAEPEKGGPRWYDKAPLGIRMADGTGHPIQGDRHPDTTAEAIRWQICEGELVQAIGRARAVNRTAETPVQIEIWNDAVLPITVDQVAAWDQVPAGREIEMAASGVVLESPSDMAACWPAVWKDAQAAKDWLRRTTGVHSPIEKILYREMHPCAPQDRPPLAFRYQHHGERQKWRQGYADPDVVPDPRSWLEARLGALRGFEIVGRG